MAWLAIVNVFVSPKVAVSNVFTVPKVTKLSPAARVNVSADLVNLTSASDVLAVTATTVAISVLIKAVIVWLTAVPTLTWNLLFGSLIPVATPNNFLLSGSVTRLSVVTSAKSFAPSNVLW